MEINLTDLVTTLVLPTFVHLNYVCMWGKTYPFTLYLYKYVLYYFKTPPQSITTHKSNHNAVCLHVYTRRLEKEYLNYAYLGTLLNIPFPQED